MAQIPAKRGVKPTAILIVRLLFLYVFTKFPIVAKHFVVHLYSRLNLATSVTLYKLLDPYDVILI